MGICREIDESTFVIRRTILGIEKNQTLKLRQTIWIIQIISSIRYTEPTNTNNFLFEATRKTHWNRPSTGI